MGEQQNVAKKDVKIKLWEKEFVLSTEQKKNEQEQNAAKKDVKIKLWEKEFVLGMVHASVARDKLIHRRAESIHFAQGSLALLT